jgi:hypothetical protein
MDGRHFELERFRRLEIDRQLEPGRELHRQLADIGAAEDIIDVTGGAANKFVRSLE